MEQQLNRIKNKDLSKMDERLFAGLDKLQTIDSTLQNLGQFQQFLLQQITQFEQKAKQKNHDKQVTEVIEQNCTTLRESIMKVVPEIQQTHSRLRMSHLSPVHRFRSTGFQNWKAPQNKKIQKIDQKRQENSKYLENCEQRFNQQSQQTLTKKIEQLTKETTTIKLQQQRIKESLDSSAKIIKAQFKNKYENKLKELFEQNLSLKQQNQSLKNQIEKVILNQQKFTQKDLQKKQNQKNKENHIQHKESNSYIDKIRSQFSAKLKNNYDPIFDENIKIQRPSTFRQSSNVNLKNIQNKRLNQDEKNFCSVQMKKNIFQDALKEKDLNVPKLLRKNSVLGINQLINNKSQQSSTVKSRLPIKELNQQVLFPDTFHLRSKSVYENDQSPNQTCLQKNQSSSTCKKTNHDLMRKTKSNFFTNSESNKQNNLTQKNETKMDLINTNEFKSKELINQRPQNKRRSQSKQKLKIVSLL